MVLEGRPPVTNLYSSAIFIGWGTMVLGLILEKIYRVGIGSLVASLAGFITLTIAHNLALGGDTMEMLRAVLDTNFWLATHVITITLGYCRDLRRRLAGDPLHLPGRVHAAAHPEDRSPERGCPHPQHCRQPAGSEPARSAPTQSATLPLPKGEGRGEGEAAGRYAIAKSQMARSQITLGQALGTMVYGIICFATLFSFMGTVLGGIWADQSWGRFWGWDPKENGALLIVLWNAVILHARWGDIGGERAS